MFCYLSSSTAVCYLFFFFSKENDMLSAVQNSIHDFFHYSLGCYFTACRSLHVFQHLFNLITLLSVYICTVDSCWFSICLYALQEKWMVRKLGGLLSPWCQDEVRPVLPRNALHVRTLLDSRKVPVQKQRYLRTVRFWAFLFCGLSFHTNL